MHKVADGVWYFRDYLVNVCFVESVNGWVLVDAGVRQSPDAVMAHARRLFGEHPPQCIVLTHGHFDHVGPLPELLRQWDVPVYAHQLEVPYLTGQSDYPPPDPTVGGGAMARLAWMYPRQGLDLGDRVQALPGSGAVPELPDWDWIHTPGHTPGHVSLFRAEDRTLIAGDAFTTVQQESAIAVLTQHRQIHGPPAYYTTDWNDAHDSVAILDGLEPAAAITGHGLPMYGPALQSDLRWLLMNFDRIAVPADGRYVREPAEADEQGVLYVPGPRMDWFWGGIAIAGLALAGLGTAAVLAQLGGQVSAPVPDPTPAPRDELELMSAALEGRYAAAR